VVNEGKKQRGRVTVSNEPCPYCGSLRDMLGLYLLDDHYYVNQCRDCGKAFTVINGQVYEKNLEASP